MLEKGKRQMTTFAQRVLRSPVVDLLLGPHDVDRYLELIDPRLTVTDARAEVVAVARQTPRSVTLTLRPNRAFGGARAGQFVGVGVEIDGVRRTRTYSPAGSEHAPGRELELTVTEHPGGLVSRHLVRHARPGMLLHLGAAQGEFTLPTPRPRRLVLISGGSAITPVLAMLRTLADEGAAREVRFLHYARTESDWLYEREVRSLSGPAALYATTRGARPTRLSANALGARVDDDTWAAVCGPPSLIEAAREAWAQRGGHPERLLSESFTPARLTVSGEAAAGTLRFLRSRTTAAIATGTLLEQAEAAGLEPKFGLPDGHLPHLHLPQGGGRGAQRAHRRGLRRRRRGHPACVSVPAGDVALAL